MIRIDAAPESAEQSTDMGYRMYISIEYTNPREEKLAREALRAIFIRRSEEANLYERDEDINEVIDAYITPVTMCSKPYLAFNTLHISAPRSMTLKQLAQGLIDEILNDCEFPATIMVRLQPLPVALPHAHMYKSEKADYDALFGKPLLH